jgi:predicted Zn-dependent protease
MRTMTRFAALVAACTLSAQSWAQFKPSPAQQVQLGQRAAAEVRQKERVLPTGDARVRTVRAIGAKLIGVIPASERQKMPWEFSFDVVDNKTMNAFALPGGPTFFYTGLFDKLRTEDQIAGVLAHEIAHTRKQHWASAYADNQKRSLGILAVLTILGANKTAFDIASVSNALLFTLPFSRKHETEADNIGYDMLTAAGYNPQGMVDVFKLLSQGGSGAPEFLSTHPDAKGRVRKLEQRVASDSHSYPAQRLIRR